DFYLIEGKKGQRIEALMRKDSALQQVEPFTRIEFKSERFKHVLTHQHIFAQFVILSLASGFPVKKLSDALGIKLYSLAEIAALPKPALVSLFLTKKGILE
ncbi:MAG: hypothetical protein RIF39_04460, partial [Cyclobacteriaceae bacterium]